MAVVYSQNGVIVRETNNKSVIGGKTYRTVKMPDGKVWLAENLDFKFCQVGGSGSSTTPNAWYYDNNEATYGWEGKKYGLLYNWYAIKFLNNNRNDLCPGWHVPSTTEWDTLASALGGASTAGTILKSTTDWTSGAGTDEYGFTALPSGFYDVSFSYLGSRSIFWTSIEYNSSSSYDRLLFPGDSLESTHNVKTCGFSLRLVRDAT